MVFVEFCSYEFSTKQEIRPLVYQNVAHQTLWDRKVPILVLLKSSRLARYIINVIAIVRRPWHSAM